MPGSSSSGAEEPARPSENAVTGAFEPRRSRREWLLVLAALALAIPLWHWRGSWLAPGSTVELPITLVTSDKDELSCALGEAPAGLRCEYRAPERPWADATPAKTLAPYMTVSRQLLLLPVLFEDPALAERYARDEPRRKHGARLSRFTAHCTVRLLQKVRGVHTRWQRAGRWGHAGEAWVAEPVACRVEG